MKISSLIDETHESLKTTIIRFCFAVIFSIALAYIESAVVVYLRIILHPEGFAFPLTNFGDNLLWQQILITEIAREAATIVVIITAAYLFGKNNQQRFAYFFTIFAVWDIFYYVWLKVLINWPASIMDWDILFLIPIVWASPVLAPVLVSITMLIFAIGIFYLNSKNISLKITVPELTGFILSAVVIVISFCIGGLRINQPDYNSYFYWPLFACALLVAAVLFTKCTLKKTA